MLPSFCIFLVIAFIFYILHPFTTDDKCFEFKQKCCCKSRKYSRTKDEPDTVDPSDCI